MELRLLENQLQIIVRGRDMVHIPIVIPTFELLTWNGRGGFPVQILQKPRSTVEFTVNIPSGIINSWDIAVRYWRSLKGWCFLNFLPSKPKILIGKFYEVWEVFISSVPLRRVDLFVSNMLWGADWFIYWVDAAGVRRWLTSLYLSLSRAN